MDGSEKKEIYFAGGCFWGVEEYFSRIPGVSETLAGYANGHSESPTYDAVCFEGTGHAEAVRVIYDPQLVSLKTLALQFFKIIDPLSVNRQGNDCGVQYRTGVYYLDTADLPILKSIFGKEQEKYDAPLAVELAPLQNFYPAEAYHQRYLKRNKNGYCHIRFDSLDDLDRPEEI
jgi:peptide methionine sulfoxide reductase msrA/msrB